MYEDPYNKLGEMLENSGITEEDLMSQPKLSANTAAKIRGLRLQASKVIDPESAVVKVGIDNPIPGVGFLLFEGEEIAITDPAAFAEICKEANVIDIYAKSDGKIAYELTFHD